MKNYKLEDKIGLIDDELIPYNFNVSLILIHWSNFFFAYLVILLHYIKLFREKFFHFNFLFYLFLLYSIFHFLNVKYKNFICFQARFWMQVVDELRRGVRLKKINFSHTPTEYELTPYEILMEDIRSR